MTQQIFKGDRHPHRFAIAGVMRLPSKPHTSKIMTEDINKSYVQRYVDRAKSTESEAEKNNCLYRAGTHMEVIDCNGNDNLTPEQRQTVLDAADKLLGGSN